jgi:diguanylate cyclase (GGDEF)-like protein
MITGIALHLLRKIQILLSRPTDLPARDLKVYRGLIDHLHADVGSVAGGVIGIMTLAFLSHTYDSDNGFLTMMIVMGAVGFTRLALILHYRKHLSGHDKSFKTIRRWELIYGAGAVCFALVLGVFAVMVFSDSYTTALQPITCATVVGYAGGIAGRNAGRPMVAYTQVLASVSPLALYLMFSTTGLELGLAILLTIYALTLFKIVRTLELIVTKAFIKERDVGEMNEKLDAAITHMLSGLCMVGADGTIQVINSRFRQLLDLPDVKYEKLHEIMISALPRGTLHHAQISDIQANLGSEAEMVLKFITDSGSVLVLKSGPTPQGGSIITLDDVTEQTRAAANVERMAKYDTLTGLYNRHSIVSSLEAALGFMTNHKSDHKTTATSLMIIDLDRFKEINDSLGHDTGDRLLIKVADRVRSHAPRDAVVGRLGGDEFVLILPATDLDAALLVAEKLVKALAKPYRIGRNLCETTASIGLAVGPDHGADSSQLMKAADIALYSRKARGRNGVDVFNAAMAAKVERRRTMEHDLALAIRNNTITLHFQPIVAAEDGRVIACESLARWTHPEFGSVPPDEFIPIAESTGLIVDLGRNVLMAACREAMNWPDHIKVSVNVSPLQLKNKEGLFNDIWLALSASGLPASRLDLEMTESMLIDDAEGVKKMMEALRAMDISISLDDFGTGYSSLAYVQNYRFDKIKLDKAFARTIADDRTTRATIAALANIAAVTGSKLLLEGVETEEQARIAVAHGVQEMQGFYFSRPVPADEILSKIRGKLHNKRAA